MDRKLLKLIGIFSLALVVLLVVVLPVRADIYRYIDETGVMHFTNAPTSCIHKFKIYLKEKPKINAGLPIIKIISMVAPLLGLLGTVTGMIIVFQAITILSRMPPSATGCHSRC